MTERSSAELQRDEELGTLLRDSLAPYHEAAFMSRMRSLLARQRVRSWDEVLAQWFWRGLAAATVAFIASGLVFPSPSGAAASRLVTQDEVVSLTDESSFADQLLQGRSPVVDIFMVSMREPR